MLENIFLKIQNDTENWNSLKHIFNEQNYSPKTILLREGAVSNRIYFIKSGALRIWFNKDGKDVTMQFFFEGGAVSSIDSFINEAPSMFTIETLEKSCLLEIKKTDFELILKIYPELKDEFYKILLNRFKNYAELFLSRIRDTPKERYEDLIKNRTDIIQRVPQRYIASYLGITPVSLSRIRNVK